MRIVTDPGRDEKGSARAGSYNVRGKRDCDCARSEIGSRNPGIRGIEVGVPVGVDIYVESVHIAAYLSTRSGPLRRVAHRDALDGLRSIEGIGNSESQKRRHGLACGDRPVAERYLLGSRHFHDDHIRGVAHTRHRAGGGHIAYARGRGRELPG